MTPQEARELVGKGEALLIDVREEDELQDSGTAEGALWMPLSAIDHETEEWQRFRQSLPRDKTLILFCKLGGRSGRVAECLGCEGYQTVNLGGFGDWAAAGLPVVPFSSLKK